jgi:hypothetical protein
MFLSLTIADILNTCIFVIWASFYFQLKQLFIDKKAVIFLFQIYYTHESYSHPIVKVILNIYSIRKLLKNQ